MRGAKKTGNKYYVQVLDERDKLREDVAKFNEKLELIRTCGTEPLKAECFRYREVLEEIEKYCTDYCDDCPGDDIPQTYDKCIDCVADDIKDIINKVKGEDQ